MKTIKFRAWDSKNKEMHYCGQEADIIFMFGKNGIECIDTRDVSPIGEGVVFNNDLIYMQYADDSHDVYEGDIVKHSFMEYMGHGNVDVREENVTVESIKKLPFDSATVDVEVIGNIYENSELLENLEVNKWKK